MRPIYQGQGNTTDIYRGCQRRGLRGSVCPKDSPANASDVAGNGSAEQPPDDLQEEIRSQQMKEWNDE